MAWIVGLVALAVEVGLLGLVVVLCERRLAMAGHTPGPWMVDPERPFTVVNDEHNQDDVAYVGLSKADARLIAAAPDLLEALKEIVEHPAAFYDWAGRLRQKAQAAIAKAEGQTCVK